MEAGNAVRAYGILFGNQEEWTLGAVGVGLETHPSGVYSGAKGSRIQRECNRSNPGAWEGALEVYADQVEGIGARALS
jgi:hypothetical protein